LIHSAWWLAEGWNLYQVHDLLDQPPIYASGLQSFIVERERANAHIQNVNSTGDDLARVIALNDLAWTLTINGVVNLKPKEPNVSEIHGTAKTTDCGMGGEIPKTAQEAAIKAMCPL
jgi:hypothetical protein